MLLGQKAALETHYDILSVKEDASYEEIRASYRSAVLNYHPDKLQKTSELSNSSNELRDKFLKVQKAWEILSNPRLRAIYDCELRALREDAGAAEEVILKDMFLQHLGGVFVFSYQCRCGDYFRVDSSDLEELGCKLLRNKSEIFVEVPDDSPAIVDIPCVSCSRRILLSIVEDAKFTSEESSCL